MPSFSKSSKDKLATCDPRLQKVFNEVIKHWDCTIIFGFRGKEKQNELFNAKPKRSKKRWPNSKHNSSPAKAIDAAPYPVDWEDAERFYAFGGFVLGAPVTIDDNMPVLAANSYSIAYANFNRAYRIIDRRGITLIRDNITAKGTTKFNFRKRVGGGIKNFEAIKLMKFST